MKKNKNIQINDIDMHYEQYQKSYIINNYSNFILRKSVDLAEVYEGMTVLDYGCGNMNLRKYLPKKTNYYGYDIIPLFSDISNFSVKKYNIIFAIQVLHYIGNNELNSLITNFSKLSNKLVIMCPDQT